MKIFRSPKLGNNHGRRRVSVTVKRNFYYHVKVYAAWTVLEQHTGAATKNCAGGGSEKAKRVHVDTQNRRQITWYEDAPWQNSLEIWMKSLTLKIRRFSGSEDWRSKYINLWTIQTNSIPFYIFQFQVVAMLYFFFKSTTELIRKRE